MGKGVVAVCVTVIYRMEVMDIMRNGQDSKKKSVKERKKPKGKSKHNNKAELPPQGGASIRLNTVKGGHFERRVITHL